MIRRRAEIGKYNMSGIERARNAQNLREYLFANRNTTDNNNNNKNADINNDPRSNAKTKNSRNKSEFRMFSCVRRKKIFKARSKMQKFEREREREGGVGGGGCGRDGAIPHRQRKNKPIEIKRAMQ